MVLNWNMAGVLPPVRPGQPGHSTDRSPYTVSLADFVDRFSTSPQRNAILQGFLHLRAAFHAAGISTGFQWVDGSFSENVELTEARPPGDVDVVTYFELPSGISELDFYNSNQALFNHPYVKATYRVDHYPQVLGKVMDASQIQQVSYWYSMWSHRRDALWKGFLQISLDPAEDSQALQILAAKVSAGVGP